MSFPRTRRYWSTPLGWLLPAVARANFSLAAGILQAALNDSFVHGFNEAVNHEAHYNPPQKYPPQTCENNFPLSFHSSTY